MAHGFELFASLLLLVLGGFLAWYFHLLPTSRTRPRGPRCREITSKRVQAPPSDPHGQRRPDGRPALVRAEPRYHASTVVATRLWAVEWEDGRLSVLSACTEVMARRRAVEELDFVQENWPGPSSRLIRLSAPADLLQMTVGTRSTGNSPGRGRVVVGSDEIAWTGPHPGGRPAAAAPEPRRHTWILPGFRELSPVFLWSAVSLGLGLVLFNARDRQEAARRAPDFASFVGSFPDLESIQRVELHLAPVQGCLAPVCFKLWIEGTRVGWPNVEPLFPDSELDPPLLPPSAAAELRIPDYTFTRAYGAEQRRWRRDQL